MKRKLSSIWRIGIALMLVLGMSLVVAAPAAADNISGLELTVTPSITGAEAYYKVVFQVHNGLQGGTDTLSVKFPDEIMLPAALGTAFTDKIIISTATTKAGAEAVTPGSDPSAVTLTGQTVKIWLPAGMSIPDENWVMVEFGGGTPLQGNPDVSAGIINPGTVGTYSLCAWTCEEPTEVCVNYNITIPDGPVDVYLMYQYSEDECCTYTDYYMTSKDTITLALAYVATDLYAQAEYECLGCGVPSCPAEEGGTFYGAKVVVHDGTYAENIVISTPCVTLESMNGAAATTIDASATTPADRPAAVLIKEDNVTFGGAGVGFTVIAPDDAAPGVNPEYYGVEIWLGIDCATIEGNIITGEVQSPQVGIHVWGALDDGDGNGHRTIKILSNTLTTAYTTEADWAKTSAGIFFYDLQAFGSLIDGNTITGFSVGVDLNGGVGLDGDPIIISNNVVNGSAFNGVELTGDYLQVNGNSIYGNGGNGIAIKDCPANELKVYRNSIHGNGNGVRVYDTADASKIMVRYNDIYENTNTLPANLAAFLAPYAYENYGVKNLDEGSTLDAKENYWGSMGGPSCGPAPCTCPSGVDQRSLALGNGDAVSHYVYYNPWLSVPHATVISEGVRYYGSDTLTLQAGWNTLSVPLALYTPADTLAEIQAGLGNFLTTTNWATAYQYNPALPGWETPTTLVPGRGYYIKMNTPSKFPVLYSNQLGLPAVDLAAGWNLIGSTFGIDKDPEGDEQGRWAVANPDKDGNGIPGGADTDAESTMFVGVALDSIGGQASVVVSPSVPGQLAIWSTVYASSAENPMYTGDAYWVFMTSSGTLAGFEITPFYFVPNYTPVAP